jgi:hypothetical protein
LYPTSGKRRHIEAARWQTVACILLVALTVVSSGCATHTQTGALVGGAAGAAVGAGIGGAVGGKEGALIGGVLGTILGTTTGAAVGQHFDGRQERTRHQAAQSNDYAPARGPLLEVFEPEVTPRLVHPGDTVQIRVTYDVLAPQPDKPIPITETWVFKHDGKELTAISRPEELKEQGGHTSTFTFTMAKDALPGAYQTIVTVSNGITTKTVATQFQVRN